MFLPIRCTIILTTWCWWDDCVPVWVIPVHASQEMIYKQIGWINGQAVFQADYGDTEYNGVVADLTHRKARIRWTAADQLGKAGDCRAVESLIIALKDPHWLVRLHAAKALGRIRDSRAVVPLVNAAADKCPFVRRRVLVALGRFDEAVIPVLAFALSDPDKGVRVCAVEGLSQFNTPRVAVLVASAMRDRDTNVSWRAAEALEKMGGVVVDALVALLVDADDKVRYRAIKTLGSMGDPRAIGPLTEILNNDPDEMLRRRAKLALRQIDY